MLTSKIPSYEKIIVILAALLICRVGFSQDTITKKNGEDVMVKVLEVDNTNVKYKLSSEPNGPTYTMRKSEILLIRYESGRNEVFNASSYEPFSYGVDREPIADLKPGMKYKELKKIYTHEDWYPEVGDRYNPALMGVCSWIIPGLGQILSGEINRGLGYLGGAVGASVLAGVGGSIFMSRGVESAAAICIAAGSLAYLAIDICAIVDASRVAKVKNLYEQDYKRLNNYSLNIYPSVDYIVTSNGYQATSGLTLALKF